MNPIQEIVEVDSVLRTKWLQVEEAANLVVDFESRFGEAAIELACHAALPLVVDASMVQLIRQNFLAHATLPWIVDADILLSPLCRPIGGECYQFEPRIRECLLVDLEDRFGSTRQTLLGEWVLAFGDSPLSRSYPVDVKQTHRWIGLAYTQPEQLVREMVQTSREMAQTPSSSPWNISGHIQVATTMEMVKDVLEQRMGGDSETLQDLNHHAKLMAYYWYGDRESLERQVQDISNVPEKRLVGDKSQLAVSINWIKGQVASGIEEVSESNEVIPPYQLPPAIAEEGSIGSDETLTDEQVDALVKEWAVKIQQSPSTVVALKGASGANRTQVVRALAEALAPQFPDGLGYVDAREHRAESMSQEQFLLAVLQAFAFAIRSNPPALDVLVREYQDFFQQKKTLTVVDYLEAIKLGLDDSETAGRKARGRPLAKGQYGESKYGKTKYSSASNAAAEIFFPHLDPSPGNVLILVGNRIPSNISECLYLNLDEVVIPVSPAPPAYIQEKRYDIFISYAHIDNQPVSEGEKGWVDQFQRALQIRMKLILGRSAQIWCDHELEDNRNIDEALTTRIQTTSILLAVCSPGYFQSDWCQRELRKFLEVAPLDGAGRIGEYARVFKVIKAPVPRETYPGSLQMLLGYEFFEEDIFGSIFQEFFQGQREDSSLKYWEKLEDLAKDICKVLHMLGNEGTRESPKFPMNLDDAVNQVSPDRPGLPQNETHDIYMSYAHQDEERVRPIIEGLKAEGWSVWFWEDVQNPGENWEEQIRQAVHSSKVHIVVVSKNSESSPYVMREAEMLLKNGKMIPVFLDRMPMPPILQGIQKVDLRGWQGNRKDEKWDQFVRRLEITLGPPTSREAVAIPKDMALIPKGLFLYGDEKTEISIDHDFFLDVHPVTNADFARFIKAGGYKDQSYWSKEGRKWSQKEKNTEPNYWTASKFNQPDQPVVGVSYFEAEAYAKWVGKRLPTEQEWEKAARGTDGREYPWGEEFDASRCASSVEKTQGRAATVGSYPEGQSPYGCQDMAGNVCDWCESWYDADKDVRVIRGGSWNDEARDLRTAGRGNLRPAYWLSGIGFRCAQDAP